MEWIKIKDPCNPIPELPKDEYFLVTQGDISFLAVVKKSMEEDEDIESEFVVIANPDLKFRASARFFDYYAKIEMPKEKLCQ